MTVVIFDGPDKCGKTEMATELSKRIGIPYFKNTSEWSAFENDPDYFRNALKYGDSYFYSFLRDTGTNVILDRSYPSEWVYSKVFDRERDENVLRSIDNIASQCGARIVIPYRTSYEGISDDVHDIGSERLQEIDAAYEEFARWTNCNVLRICVDCEDIELEMKEIINFLR
jgi:hypothetical protein